MDVSVLEQLGLSQKEIAIYIALLHRGASSVSVIADASGVDRTLCYSLLNKLIARGYASFAVVGKAKQFSAVAPAKLLADLQLQEERLNELLPELQRLAQKHVSPLEVQVFKGKEGVRGVFADFLSLKEDAFLFGDLVRFQEVVPLQLEKYFQHLKQNNLFEHLIFPEGDDLLMDLSYSKYRTVPRKLVSSSAVWVYADRTALTVWSNPPLIIFIKNKAVAENYRSYFDYLWKLGSKKGVLSKRKGSLK